MSLYLEKEKTFRRLTIYNPQKTPSEKGSPWWHFFAIPRCPPPHWRYGTAPPLMRRHQGGVKCHISALPPLLTQQSPFTAAWGTSANTDISTVFAHIAKVHAYAGTAPSRNLMQIPDPLSVIVSIHCWRVKVRCTPCEGERRFNRAGAIKHKFKKSISAWFQSWHQIPGHWECNSPFFSVNPCCLVTDCQRNLILQD